MDGSLSKTATVDRVASKTNHKTRDRGGGAAAQSNEAGERHTSGGGMITNKNGKRGGSVPHLTMKDIEVIAD